MTAQTQKVRFLVMSDTHDAIPEPYNPNHPLSKLPKVDVLFHCGDLTNHGSGEDVLRTIKWIRDVPVGLKLVIPGNHDACLNPIFWAKQNGAPGECETIVHIRSDQVKVPHGLYVLGEGTYKFSLASGATFRVFASPYTPEYGVGAFQYETCIDRFNPHECPRPEWAIGDTQPWSIIPDDVNLIMAHGSPHLILDRTSDDRAGGCPHLRDALARVQPKLHVFGHIHTGYGAQRIDWSNSASVFPGAVVDDKLVNVFPQEYVSKN